MEFITILLSALLTFISPAGLVIDRAAENAIRSRLESVEQLQVRVDNPPSYQIVQGKVERVRIAGRGLRVTPDIRIAALEVETDPIDVDVQSLRRGGKTPPLKALRSPLQAATRVVLSQEDVNQALRSPDITNRLRNLGSRVLDVPEAEQLQRYEIFNPRVEFLDNNRARFQVEVQERGYPERLAILVETGVEVIGGRRLQLTEPAVLVNGEAAPARVVQGLAVGISRRLDLQTFEKTGILARLLELKISPAQLEMAAFVRVEPR